MSIYLINDSTLEDIADAIRAKTGGSSDITPLEMPSEISSISGGGNLSGLTLLGYVTSAKNNTSNDYTFSQSVLGGRSEVLFISGVNNDGVGGGGGYHQCMNKINSVTGGTLTKLVEGSTIGSLGFSAGVVSNIASDASLTINIQHNLANAYVSNTVRLYGFSQ